MNYVLIKKGKIHCNRKISPKEVKQSHKELEHLYAKFAEQRLQQRQKYWKWVAENQINSNSNLTKKSDDSMQDNSSTADNNLTQSQDISHSNEENIQPRAVLGKRGQKRKNLSNLTNQSLDENSLVPAAKRRRRLLRNKSNQILTHDNEKRNNGRKFYDETLPSGKENEHEHRMSPLSSDNGTSIHSSYHSPTPKNERGELLSCISASREVDKKCNDIKNRIIQQTQNHCTQYLNHKQNRPSNAYRTSNTNSRKNALYNLRQSTLSRRRRPTMTTHSVVPREKKRERATLG